MRRSMGDDFRRVMVVGLASAILVFLNCHNLESTQAFDETCRNGFVILAQIKATSDPKSYLIESGRQGKRGISINSSFT